MTLLLEGGGEGKSWKEELQDPGEEPEGRREAVIICFGKEKEVVYTDRYAAIRKEGLIGEVYAIVVERGVKREESGEKNREETIKKEQTGMVKGGKDNLIWMPGQIEWKHISSYDDMQNKPQMLLIQSLLCESVPPSLFSTKESLPQ